MGATIDDKVVAMSFENDKFERGVKTTLSSLDKLKHSLNFPGASKGLDNVGNSLNGLRFGPLNKNIDSVRAHFSALNVAASAIIGHIAIQLTNMAERAAKALTVGPIIQGLDIYNTKIQAIQTILANTQAAGTKMKDVTAALNELNQFSNKTIFSFGEMTRNIGTFTAAGVALKPAVAAIKGIANLAALSGSNSQQASTAMYQLSQAISAGRVSLQDWNSVVNAGLGGSVFQRALAQTAVAMGKLKESSLKLVGPMKNVSVNGESFRQSIQAGPGKNSWLTSDVLTKTLSTFTGDLTDAQLAAIGFNKEQVKAIQLQAKTAVNAATQVKTFGQLMDVTKETIASGWSQSFELIIGNLDQAKKLFTDISNSMSAVINQSAASRNKILKDWSQLGGRTKLIAALKEVFKALGDVLKPVKDAFRDIFPRKTGRDLFNLTVEFKRFADTLKPSQTTVDNLRRTFRGVFALFDIGRQIIGGIVGVFAHLFGVIFKGNGSFLNLTGNIGDFLVAVDVALRKGEGLDKFFAGLTHILTVPIKLFQEITQKVSHMFDGFSPRGFSVKMDISTKATEPFHHALDAIIDALQGLGPAISKGIHDMNFQTILAVIRTGLLAALVLMIRKFIDGTTLEKTLGLFGKKIGKGFAKNLGGGILTNLSKSFGSLSGTLQAMQNNLKAKTLEEIAIAIALITASVVALSFIKPTKLNSALGSLAIGFGVLIGAMVAIDKLTDAKAAVKLPIIAASLILMATALDILTLAVVALGKLDPKELIRGLGAVAAILGTLVVSMKVLSKGAVGMAVAAFALNEVAVALNIIALAVLQFGKMNLKELGKGLIGVAGSLTAIAIAMKLMPKSIIITAGGVVVVAVALNILAIAMKKFGSMNLETIGKGLLGIGGGLVIIALAMKLMPKSIVITAAGLFIVAEALGKIVSAVGTLGNMSIKQLATGLTSLAVALGILALALTAMSGTLAGAAALTVAAAGIALFVPALIKLGQQSWTDIIKSMIALGAGFALVAGAGLLLQPVIPALIGFGAALIVIGAGLTLAGAGIALIGVGLSAIAVSGSAAVGVLIKALTDLVASLGNIAKNLILSLLQIVKTFADVAPQFVKALVKIINALADGATQAAPKLAEAFVVILTSALEALDKHANEIIKAGFNILEKLLQGINDNIGKIVTMAATIVITLVKSLAKNANRLINAGFNLIISVITGITNNIGKVLDAGANIVIRFVKGIAKDIKKVAKAGVSILISLLTGLGKNLDRFATAGGQAIVHFVNGIGNAIINVVTAAIHVASRFVHSIVNQMVRMEKVVARGIVRLLNGTADVIDQYEPQIIKATGRIGLAIVTGMIKGIGANEHLFFDKIKSMAKSAWDHLKHFWKVFSPSKLTEGLGKNIVLGMAQGLDRNAGAVHSSIADLNQTMFGLFDKLSNNGLIDASPKITPILDLSSIKNDASKLNGIINKTPVGALSLEHAAVISTRQSVAAAEKEAASAGGTSIEFKQNNFSPRELPASEIYRNTRNQLSQLKAAINN